MNKVTRLAFDGPSQFYSTTSQVCVRRFETFLGADTSLVHGRTTAKQEAGHEALFLVN
jgi:hypothetical protein